MKVLEIKNNLVKIAYEVSDNLALGGFLIIEDANTPYVAQIMNLKADVAANFAIAKLLFTFNEEGILKNYNGSIPSLKSTISKLPSNELLDILPIETPITIGKLAQQGLPLKLDKSLFEGNLVICSNKQENSNLLINNFIKEFEEINQKSVIFDFSGDFESPNKITFGEDFKLPLNYQTINYIYEKDLEDVSAESKALIQDIFLEVQDYIKTIPERYIPFNTFLDVVDQQYKETGIIELVLLKNKLLKYRDGNVFAQNLKDILNLSIAIEKANNVVIDLSAVDVNLQREIIDYIYEVMEKIRDTIYTFIKLDDSLGTKKLLKKFLNRVNIFTTIICGHEYKYLSQLKQNAQNLILFSPLTLQHDFASYNTFLSKLNPDEFIVYGNLTQNIPLIVQLADIKLLKAAEKQALDVETETEAEEIEEEETGSIYPESEDSSFESFEETETETPFEEEELQIDNVSAGPNLAQQILMDDMAESIDIEPVVTIEPQTVMYDIPDTHIGLAVKEIEPLLPNEPYLPEEENIVIEDTINIEENVIIEDDISPEFIEEDIITNVADVLTEEDLNLIDDFNTEAIIVEDTSNFSPDNQETNIEEAPEIIEDEIEEEESYEQEESAPEVPVFPADDIDASLTGEYNQGDIVSHPKYGRGVVEKMIKYGNKTLCSINFEHIGRRLLDPAVSEITKL